MSEELLCCPSVSLIESEHPADEINSRGRDSRPLLFVEVIAPALDLVEDPGGLFLEGRAATEQDVAHHSETPNVNLGAVRIASNDLWRHIGRRPERHFLRRQLRHSLCESKVSELDDAFIIVYRLMRRGKEAAREGGRDSLTSRDKDVVWLDIAMDDPDLGVQIVKRL
jgi:hypothetical protein